jgi:putative FmdB family regulatory protein
MISEAPTVPTYQYACTACGHALEAVQSFSDDPLTVCPECDGKLRKLFSSVGIVFKGSGFYRNDSREKTPAASTASSDSTKSADSTKSSESSKPAAPAQSPAPAAAPAAS